MSSYQKSDLTFFARKRGDGRYGFWWITGDTDLWADAKNDLKRTFNHGTGLRYDGQAREWTLPRYSVERLQRWADAWASQQEWNAALTAELFPLAQQTDGIKLGRGGEHEQITTLGKILGKAQDRVVNGYRIQKGPPRNKKTTWYLAPTSPHKDSPEGGCGGVRGGYSNPTREKKTFDDRGGIEKKSILLSGSECHLPPLTPPHPPAYSSTTDKRIDAAPQAQRLYANISSDNIEKVAAAVAPPSAFLLPCVGGCGTLTPNGWECRNCRMGVAVSPPSVAVAAAPSHPSTITVGASYPELPVHMLTTAHDVSRALPTLRAAPVVGVDTETTGLDPLTDRLRLVQLATAEGAYLLDTVVVDARTLAPLFDGPVGDGPLMVGQNLAFDLRFMRQAGLSTPTGARLFDTMLASQLLTASADKKGAARLSHGLGAIAQRMLGLPLDKSEQKSDWAGALTEEQVRYAALDAAVLVPLAERLRTELVSAGLERVSALEMGALPTIAWMMHVGVPFDTEAWRRLALAAQDDAARLDQEMTALAGTGGLFVGEQTSVKWSSTQQVAALLRERGHSDVTSTDEATLHQLVDAGEPLAALLLRHREASKRASTYGLDYLKHVHPLTGRIHARFIQLGSQAGRMSAAAPNVQQVPRRQAYRACVRPGPGRALIKADYAQIELRLAAQIAPDERLVEAFQRGDDLHTVTARTVLGKTDVTKADRQAAKAVNFGLLYGMGAKGLRQYAADEYGVQWTEEEAQTVRGRFFAEYRGLQAWHRSQTDGEVETRTIAGRRRLGVERYTEKLNSPVQGSGADGLKAALGRLWETRHRVPGAAPILVVHDEIVVECDRDQAEEARAWVMDAMRSGMETVLQRVPTEVEATICSDWSGTALDGGAP